MIPIPTEKDLQQVMVLPELPAYVAKGGFKAVFSIKTDTVGDEALKAVYLEPSKTEQEELRRQQLLARALREIEVLRLCDSAKLVKLGSIAPRIESVSGHDYLLYSEEYLPGRPLIDQLKSGATLDFPDLLEIFETMLDVIEILVKMGFLHRDIKPQNIMATGLHQRPYVLLDLGIAFKVEGTELTQGGGAPGTTLFMAPELFSPDYKDNLDFRCDLYAAALTIYVMATGNHPFAGSPANPYMTWQRILKEVPAPLVKTRPDIPVPFCNIIDRSIKKKPALRYANLKLVREALKETKA
jgi:serine/threonine-protein kinase